MLILDFIFTEKLNLQVFYSGAYCMQAPERSGCLFSFLKIKEYDYFLLAYLWSKQVTLSLNKKYQITPNNFQITHQYFQITPNFSNKRPPAEKGRSTYRKRELKKTGTYSILSYCLTFIECGCSKGAGRLFEIL